MNVLVRALSEELLGPSDQFGIGHEDESGGVKVENLDLKGKKVGVYSLMEKAAQCH